MNRRAIVALLALAAAIFAADPLAARDPAPARSAGGTWLRAAAAHFTFYSEADPAQTSAVAGAAAAGRPGGAVSRAPGSP